MQAQLKRPAVGVVMPPREAAASAATAPRNLSILRNIKIGTFHIGSSMADILASGVWNRVMIKELGYAATPIALLLALRYFLAPFSIWVGNRSDTSPIAGYHRLPYIWGGRIAMVVSYFLLGFATLELARGYDPVLKQLTFGLFGATHVGNGSLLGWLGVVTALILFSVGSTASGTTFLSLIYDRTPEKQRRRAVSVVWFFLILGFAVAGVIYSRLLPEYTQSGFLSLFLIAPLIMAGLWFFSIVGEEARRDRAIRAAAGAPTRSVWAEIKAAWANRQTRIFFLFLTLTTIFFYMQDVILEPFAGEVFGMPLATTNRFSAYWGSLTLAGIIVSLLAARRFPKTVNNTSLSRWGVIVLIGTFALFALSSFAQIRPLVTVGLVLMGIGLGMWTVGSLGLMMDMTRAWGAGLYLALWTVSSTLARGTGVASGGVLLDLSLGLAGGSATGGYGLVFVIQAVGFVVTLFILARLNVAEFMGDAPQSETVMANTMD